MPAVRNVSVRISETLVFVWEYPKYEELISRFGTPAAPSRRLDSVGLYCQYGPRSASVGSLSRTNTQGSAGIDRPRPSYRVWMMNLRSIAIEMACRTRSSWY